MPQLQAAAMRGVSIFLITKSHSERSRAELPQIREMEAQLSVMGAVVVHKMRMHEKLVFVDDDIILPQDYAAKLIAFVETAETPTAAMGRIVSRPESYWNRVLDYSNFWWLQVEHDISDLGWLGAGATLVPFEMVQEIRFSESLMVNEDTDFFRRIADKSKGTLGICSDVTGFHVQGELKLVDLAKKQYWNGCSSLMQFHSHELSFVSLWFGLRNIVAALKKTSAANRSDLMARPMLFVGIFLSFACYEAGIISGISRLRRGNR